MYSSGIADLDAHDCFASGASVMTPGFTYRCSWKMAVFPYMQIVAARKVSLLQVYRLACVMSTSPTLAPPGTHQRPATAPGRCTWDITPTAHVLLAACPKTKPIVLRTNIHAQRGRRLLGLTFMASCCPSTNTAWTGSAEQCVVATFNLPLF